MKKIFVFGLIFIILIMAKAFIYSDYEPINNEETLEQDYQTKYEKEEFSDTYKGYDVCAKMEIPCISLNTNILSNYSEQSLKVSVVKFWGVNPNHIGNFCIAGHNFIRKNMFHNLKDLKIGDVFFITDKEIGKVKYEIFDIYQVDPADVSVLDAVTSNEREVTLITCTKDSKKRIIVKAKEYSIGKINKNA